MAKENVAKLKPLSSNPHPTLLVTKYMGSKKAILEFVASELIKLTKPGDIIVDLMAGTHTIGYAMKSRCKMIANDIQRYSRVIGETLLNYYPEPRFEGVLLDTFRRFYVANARHLADIFGHGLQREQEMLSSNSGTKFSWFEYREFCESYPYYLRETPALGWQDEFSLLFGHRRVEAYRTLNKLEPYSLFSLYYANSYIGVQQAAEIDSIRCAIDKLCDLWLPQRDELKHVDAYRLRCLLISALIGVINKINPGPGHWAAYQHVSDHNLEYMKTQRRQSVWDIFIDRVREFENNILSNPSDMGPHIVMTEDYVNFMEEVHEYIRQARVVYLDPPYSQGHYSRFYHLIETLVLYDYPEISFSGRYRTNRHQSPFAHKEKVASAIGKVCEIAREGNAVLVSSYSKGGVIPDDKAFRKILEEYYPPKNVSVKKLISVHSKLGQANRMKTEEYLFECKP